MFHLHMTFDLHWDTARLSLDKLDKAILYIIINSLITLLNV